jgi:hypothetical protein
MWIFLITVKDWPVFRSGWWLQEQSLSSQIVRVVIAGGSVDLQTSLSNGQVCWDFFSPCIFYLVAFFSWIFCLQSHWCNALLVPSWSCAVSKFVMSSTPTRLQNILLLVKEQDKWCTWFCGLQPLSGKEQTKLVEPIRELDLALTQVPIVIHEYCKWVVTQFWV